MMATPDRIVTLQARDLYGSRLRCLLLTHQPPGTVARLLTELVHPYATVSPSAFWMPRGFLQSEEAKLGEAEGFLSAGAREAVTAWWLARRAGANTPNWDIACTADIEGRRGLVLVEAKAHSTEMKKDGKDLGHPENEISIRAAIRQANEGLNGLEAGWNLAADSHYQLCNRFAWAWKVASLGVPVVLVYLGFLNAEDMAKRGQPFRTANEWADAVRSHAQGLVPDSAWDKRLDVEGTPLRVLIRAMDLRWVATGC
jgi:hypothetical protein